MLNKRFLDVFVLLFAGLVMPVTITIEEIPIFLGFVNDVDRHFEAGVLEFDNEVDKNFIFCLRNRKLFTDFPEFLGHPVSDYRHVF